MAKCNPKTGKPGVCQIRDCSTGVCFEHFKDRGNFGGRKHCNARLRRHAVPSIFPWGSAGPASRPHPTNARLTLADLNL